MSKSELKRLCTQNPIGMAEEMAKMQSELAQLKQREMVLVAEFTALANEMIAGGDYVHTGRTILKVLNATPSQTADQVLRWHVESDSK